jgi:putative flippase GtrA
MNQPATRILLAGFLQVGGLGFLLDAAVFQILIVAGIDLIVARVVSASMSVTMTWYLNRHLVFRTGAVNKSLSEYGRYIGVQAVGLSVNFGVYLVLIGNFLTLRRVPILALCAGATAALTLNFIGARYFAFRTSRMREQADV